MAACCDGDRLGPKLEALLGCAQATLLECDVPVCRAFLSTSTQPPWDVCCECGEGVGQLWVSVDRIEPINQVAGGTTKCGNIWEANVWIGVMRCALTQNDMGDAPDADDLTAEALAIVKDRLLIMQAIRCCYGPANEPDEWTIGNWQSLGPMGGCVGGRQNITIRFADPKCA